MERPNNHPDNEASVSNNTKVQDKRNQQNEQLQKQLRMLQIEEKSLHSILSELRSQSRKLNVEKYRLLDLCKAKNEEQEEKDSKRDQQPGSNDQNPFNFQFSWPE